jgi:hypothetical protein
MTDKLKLKLSQLPALKAPLLNGIFAGLTTKPNGTHCAVVLLPEHGPEITWDKAVAWATEQGGELPSRPVAALLFANVKDQLKRGWHWTSEQDEDDASYAWDCYFDDGYQTSNRKSFEGSAVAVRLIELEVK